MKKEKSKDKYEVIIPERRYIVHSLEEARRVMERYTVEGVCIRLIK